MQRKTPLRPGSAILPSEHRDWRELVASSRWSDASNIRMYRMINRIIALGNDCGVQMFPMTQDKAEYAIWKLLCEGGANGGVACDSAIYDFKRAVSHWHFRNRKKVPNMEEWDLDWYFSTLPNLRTKLPKNVAINPHASHGHLQLPFDIFLRTARYWLQELSWHLDPTRKAASRDLVMLILIWVASKRQGEIFSMTRDDIIDLGIENGFSWCVTSHKTSKDVGRLVTGLPEATTYGVPVGALLRNYLKFITRLPN